MGIETIKTSSHLSPALDGVCGLMHLPRVEVGRVVEPVDQPFSDVPVGALQRQSPGPGQAASETFHPNLRLYPMAALAN